VWASELGLLEVRDSREAARMGGSAAVEYGHGPTARELQRTTVPTALPRSSVRVSKPLYRLGTHACASTCLVGALIVTALEPGNRRKHLTRLRGNLHEGSQTSSSMSGHF
jgi:hypothetical protein